MFYDNFVKLCAERNESPSGVARKIGLSNAAANGWKKGKVPSDVTLAKLAQYFGVTTDYLLGKEQKEKPAAKNDDELIEGLPITRVARNGKKMPVDQQEKLLELAKFMFPEYFNDDDSKV